MRKSLKTTLLMGTQVDRDNAAAYAVLLDSKLHSKVKIRREFDGRESPDFKKLTSKYIKTGVFIFG